MGRGGRVAIDRDIGTFHGCGRNSGNIRDAVRGRHTDGDVAGRGDRGDRDVDGASGADLGGSVQYAVFADGHKRSGNGAHWVGGHADGEDGHVAHLVGGRLHAVWHDGAVAQYVVGLPIVKRADVQFIAERLGCVAGQVADVEDGVDRVVGVVVPDGVVATGSGFIHGRHGAVGAVGGSDAEIIVVQPVGGGAGADVGVSTFVFGPHHGLAEAGAADAPVGGLAAVAHGQEVFVRIG